MSFGMFCAIPLPFQLWDDKRVNLMLPCLPIVGGIIGVLWWGFAELLVFSGIHLMIASAALALAPFFTTGFLHLDGYMDTSDAVLSRRPLEEKLRILKDPHTGAFAVIMTAALFITQFAASYAVIEKGKQLALLIVIAVISRCCSAMSVLCLKAMPQSGYGNMFKNNSGIAHKAFLAAAAAIAAGSSCFIAGASGLIVVMSAMLSFIGAISYAYINLKGVSGDLAGFALVVSELGGLIALAAT